MADEKQQKAEFSKPASQVDLEYRLKNENRSSRVLSTSDSYRELVEEDDNARDMTVEGNDLTEYIGVSVDYQNYANETEKPLAGDEGPEVEATKQILLRMEPEPEWHEPEEEDEEVKVTPTTSTLTPASPRSPEQGTEKVKNKNQSEAGGQK